MPGYEIEQKYRLKDPGATRRELAALGARPIGKARESDTFFDRGSGELRRKRCVLRLRRAGTNAYLTFKGPRLRSQFKKRVEIEMPVDFRKTRELLASLGYRVFASVSKTREKYKLRGTLITLDFVSGAGWFAEIEGRAVDILKISRRLGLHQREERSYLELAGRYKPKGGGLL